MNDKELNLLDLCAMFFRGIGRLLAACWTAIKRVVLMMYRYWWAFLLMIALTVAATWVYTRFDNLIFKANAVALINGASLQQFEQAYAPLRTVPLLPDDAAIKPYLKDNVIKRLKTFYVIDGLGDGTADYIDFGRNSSAVDSVRIRMQDRLCLQFRIKGRNLSQLRDIEDAMMAYLNSNEAMNKSYRVYVENLREAVSFNHAQAQKLDSLTSYRYFNEQTLPQLPASKPGMNSSVNVFVDNQVQLFLDKIYDQQKHMQQDDYRLQLATAPVVLENHFYLDPIPVNYRRVLLVWALIIGWLLGYALAELLANREALNAWLKQ